MTAGVQARSRATMAQRARTFSLAARLLPRRARDDAAVVYAFCRLVDDSVDEGGDVLDAALELEAIRAELAGERPARPLVTAFLEVSHRVDIPRAYADELIRGAATDLAEVRVPDEAALLRYCYGVASTVGLMMCPVLGVTDPRALPHAVDLGVGMQLTNITRDVAEDARLGRVYLPADRLRRDGIDPDEVIGGTADPVRLFDTVCAVLDLADRFYASAEAGMRFIPLRSRSAILVASRVYRAIGVRLRRRGPAALAERTVLPPTARWMTAGAAVTRLLSPHTLGWTRPTSHDPDLHRALRGLPGTAA
ncbi:MAG: phytoene/squalene synthase family protein [Longimicrobiaceae bacterium]